MGYWGLGISGRLVGPRGALDLVLLSRGFRRGTLGDRSGALGICLGEPLGRLPGLSCTWGTRGSAVSGGFWHTWGPLGLGGWSSLELLPNTRGYYRLFCGFDRQKCAWCVAPASVATHGLLALAGYPSLSRSWEICPSCGRASPVVNSEIVGPLFSEDRVSGCRPGFRVGGSQAVSVSSQVSRLWRVCPGSPVVWE